MTHPSNLNKKIWHSEDITYCSNVHPGEDLDKVLSNLRGYYFDVRQRRNLPTMTSGLWLNANTVASLQEPEQLHRFRSTLDECNLTLTSLNGFPYGNFHDAQVKEKVYLPDWSEEARALYTKQLADILAACLPEHVSTGAISTLPLGYKRLWDDTKQVAADAFLQDTLIHLADLFETTGKHILLCIEMEPDCVLESTEELIEFFQQRVHSRLKHAEHLGICYDVCHQAVMHEDIKRSLAEITSAGIHIGKIQLSNALQVKFDTTDIDRTLDLLRSFSEPRYLHQVKTMGQHNNMLTSPDLTIALDSEKDSLPYTNPWRIHFHVPLDADNLRDEHLSTTRNALLDVFDYLEQEKASRPYLEVETYTWQVLPEEMRPDDDAQLIDGIVRELNWVESELKKRKLLSGRGR